MYQKKVSKRLWRRDVGTVASKVKGIEKIFPVRRIEYVCLCISFTIKLLKVVGGRTPGDMY